MTTHKCPSCGRDVAMTDYGGGVYQGDCLPCRRAVEVGSASTGGVFAFDVPVESLVADHGLAAVFPEPEQREAYLAGLTARLVDDMSARDLRAALKSVLHTVRSRAGDADEMRAGLLDDLDGHGLLGAVGLGEEGDDGDAD